MITHSICIAYRRRPVHLWLFYQALWAAAETAANYNWELVVTDVWPPEFQTDETAIKEDKVVGNIMGDITRPFLLNWNVVQHSAPAFNKAKALNASVKASQGKFITILDVDCLMKPDFITKVEDFFADNQIEKLSHRMLLTNPHTARMFATNVGIDYMERMLAQNNQFRPEMETYEGHLIGTSQFTMSKDRYIKLGGMDERFLGWGLEDVDFNLRALRNGVPTVMNIESPLYHLHHQSESDWKNQECELKNRALFVANKAAGNRPLVVTDDWGVYGEEFTFAAPNEMDATSQTQSV